MTLYLQIFVNYALLFFATNFAITHFFSESAPLKERLHLHPEGAFVFARFKFINPLFQISYLDF